MRGKPDYRELATQLVEIKLKADEAIREIIKESPDRIKVITLVCEDLQELVVNAGDSLLREGMAAFVHASNDDDVVESADVRNGIANTFGNHLRVQVYPIPSCGYFIEFEIAKLRK